MGGSKTSLYSCIQAKEAKYYSHDGNFSTREAAEEDNSLCKRIFFPALVSREIVDAHVHLNL